MVFTKETPSYEYWSDYPCIVVGGGVKQSTTQEITHGSM